MIDEHSFSIETVLDLRRAPEIAGYREDVRVGLSSIGRASRIVVSQAFW